MVLLNFDYYLLSQWFDTKVTNQKFFVFIFCIQEYYCLIQKWIFRFFLRILEVQSVIDL